MEENKQVVAEWKALNEPRLKEIKSFNPELYSAVNLALNYLNKKLGGEELPEEVEEVIPVIETRETKQWTLDDFKDTKIMVDTPEKSRRFQELFLSLGGEWSILDAKDVKIVNNTDKQFLFTTGSKLIFVNLKDTFDEQSLKEVFYDDIFASQTKTKQFTKDDFLNKKIVVDTDDKSKKFQEFAFSLGLKWQSGENENPILLNQEYLKINPYGELSFTEKKQNFNKENKQEIFYDDIFSNESESTQSQRATTSASEEGEYAWPIETYPSKLKFPSWNLDFQKNNGDRKSPTQSAGALKRKVNQLGQSVDYIQMILETKFKGNDWNWYAINVGKGGVWTWKETTHPPAQSQMTTSNASSQPTTSETTTPTEKTWSLQDLVGKKLLWSGNEYDVVRFNKNNPKLKSYILRNKQGIEIEGKLSMSAIQDLLNDKPVKGISIIKQQPQTQSASSAFEDSITLLSDNALKQLYDDTYEARKEFSVTEPEYKELTEQIVAIGNEIDNRKI